MDVWVVATVVHHNLSSWNKILSTHETKEQAEKEMVEHWSKEIKGNLYIGVIIKKKEKG